jgi:D-alanine-D-alanine ligase
MQKLRVAVLRGGPSDEFDVSLRTGSSVVSSLDTSQFDVTDIIISPSGEWLSRGVAIYPEHLIQSHDVVFIALHGSYGEDGTVQRLLDHFNIPYTGTKAYASRIAMHKGYTKDHIRKLNTNFERWFKLPEHVIVTQNSKGVLHKIISQITELFGPEYIVKPTTSGSSRGVQHASNLFELQDILENSLNLYQEVIVERYIMGREATCGIIEGYRNQELYAFPPIEIVLPQDVKYFDYDAKYSNSSNERIPALFDYETKQIIETSAKIIHSTLNLSQYSRSDFIVASDGVYFLEVNTLPCLSHDSLFSKSISSVGGTLSKVITGITLNAYNRNL